MGRRHQLEAPTFERVEIPYEGRTLKGYFVAARGVTGRRPTVIVQNGSDAQHVDVWSFGGAAAIERGYHALLFEGPGQGAELFVDDVPFRPDREAVITPIVGYLSGRPDGAEVHDGPVAPQRRNEVVFDWLDDVLR